MLPPYFMVVHRPQKGVMAWLLRRAMPRDTRPIFVWPKLVVAIEGYFHRRWLVAIAVLLIAVTIVIAKALLLVPGLDNSVVGLLTSIFETFLPTRWATATAWTVGMAGVFLMGDLTNYTPSQMFLHKIKATRYEVYNIILFLALLEEQAFRSGSERWNWRERVRASVCFGLLHIMNIWYNFATGIALSVTGFGFLLVYLWYYRKYRIQIIATAAAATVHALYNAIALSLIAVVLAIDIAKLL